MQVRLVDQSRQEFLNPLADRSRLRLINHKVQKPRWGSFFNHVAITQSILTIMGTEDLAGHSSGERTAASGVFMGSQPGLPLEKGSVVETNVIWVELTPRPLGGQCWLVPLPWIIGGLSCWVAQLRFYFRYNVVEKVPLLWDSGVFLTEPFGDTGLPSL